MAPLILIQVGLLASLSWLRPDWMSFEIHLILSVTSCAVVIPAWFWVKDTNRRQIPFAPMVGGFFLIWYVLPPYISYSVYPEAPLDALTLETVFLVVGALVALLVGWRAVSLIGGRRSLVTTEKLSEWVAYVGLFTLIFLLVIERRPTLYALIPGSVQQLFIVLGMWARALTVGLILVRGPPKAFKALGIAVLGLDLLYALNSGLLFHVFTRLVVVGIVGAALIRRVAPLAMAICLVIGLTVAFNSIKHKYRERVWYSDSSNMTEIDKLEIWQQGFAQENWDSEDNLQELTTEAAGRASALGILELVRFSTPSFVSYRDGETLKAALVAFIPRSLWPDKPHATFGNEFGQTFGILDSWDFRTSINVPWLCDWYWNFGDVGVILGMVFTGVLMGLIDRFYNGRDLNLYDLAVALSLIWPSLIFQESNWAMSFGGLPLMIVFYAVLRKLFVRRVTPVGSTIEDTQLAANVDDTHGSALTHRPMTARAKV